jgi:hypothetical protein
LWHLPAGEYTVFAIYNGHSDDGQIVGWSPYSNTLQVSNTGGVPAAPASVTATYIPGRGSSPGYVSVHWVNSSNNETGFDIQRKEGSGNWVDVDSPTSDHTTYGDTSLGLLSESWQQDSGLGPWTYRVRAVNGNKASSWTQSLSCSAVGGPDITAHLNAIRAQIEDDITRNPGLSAKWHRDFDILQNPHQAGLWDIDPLAGQYVRTADNSGVLADGQHTVTVNGKVFDDADVDYFLYGVIFRAAGLSPADGLIDIPGWRLFNNLYNGDPASLNISPRLAWFMVGWSGNWSYADSAAIPGVSPAWESSGLLHWHVDGVKGNN